MKKRILPLAAAFLLFLSACGEETEATPAALSTGTFQPTETAMLLRPDTPPGGVVTEYRAVEGDLADKVKVEVSIPMVRIDLAGAEEVNSLIAADYAEELASEVEDFADLAGGFLYPYYHVWYEVYQFEKVYEICVLGEVYSLYGSGASRWVSRYYYDVENGGTMSAADFLALVGYTEDDVLSAFLEQEVMEEDAAGFTYEEAACYYYVDADKNLRFWSSLYA